MPPEFETDFTSRPIVVATPSFDETSGGIIVLHRLADRLRAMGQEAYVYPIGFQKRSPTFPQLQLRTRWSTWRENQEIQRQAVSTFQTNPDFDTPVAPKCILKDAIVVYPEITHLNPLGSRRVVRWLLHKPGYFFPWVRHGPSELTFYMHPVFVEGLDGIDPDNQLFVVWMREDIYFNKQYSERAGCCRLIRKGQFDGQIELPDNDQAIPIDGMPHEQVAEVFNRTRILYCHDHHTTYLLYAAMCGCVPVVVPQPGISSIDWRPNVEDRWGYAYGETEIDWAIQTRDKLLMKTAADKDKESEMIRRFLNKVKFHYG